jgi:hypothetical protein
VSGQPTGPHPCRGPGPDEWTSGREWTRWGHRSRQSSTMDRSRSCAATSPPAAPSPTTSCPITRTSLESSARSRATTLARGNYCPKEHQQHLELAANYAKIAVAYTKVATISTDSHHSSQEFRASTGAQWPFLSDPERTVQKDLEIQEYTDPEHDPMIPHTLVLKPGLVIHSVYNGYWFWGRPSFVDLWHDLRTVTREVRPDWDLSKPGLREAWDADDYASFHGWDKRSPEATPSSYNS